MSDSLPTTTEPEAKRRAGRVTLGLYPYASRTDLAALTGKHISTITSILRGRTRAKLTDAIKLAEAVGVTVEQFSRDVDEQRITLRQERARARDRERRRKKREMERGNA